MFKQAGIHTYTVIFLLLTLITMESAAKNQLQAVVVGEIQSLTGKVRISRGLKDVNASVKSPLMAGDRLYVSRNAQTSLNLNGIGEIKLIGKASFAIPKVQLNKSLHVKLMIGSLWCRIQRMAGYEKFEVQTPTATAGVRGTEFEVQYEPNKKLTTTFVDSGLVMSRNLKGKFAKLKAGTMSLIDPYRFERRKVEKRDQLQRRLRFLKVKSSQQLQGQNQRRLEETKSELEKILIEEKSGKKKINRFLRGSSSTPGNKSRKSESRMSEEDYRMKRNSLYYRNFQKSEGTFELKSPKEPNLWTQILKDDDLQKFSQVKGRQPGIQKTEDYVPYRRLMQFQDREHNQIRYLNDEMAKNSRWYREKIKRFMDSERSRSSNLPKLNRIPTLVKKGQNSKIATPRPKRQSDLQSEQLTDRARTNASGRARVKDQLKSSSRSDQQ